MKKLSILFIILTIIVLPVQAVVTNSSYTDSKAIVYFFYEEKCEQCDQEKAWLEEYVNKDNTISLEYIDTSVEKDLLNKIYDNLKINKKEMPLVVVGSSYFVGFNDNSKKEIKKAIEAYKEKEHCNLINKIRNNEDIKECLTENKNIYNNQSSNFIILMIAVGIIITGIIGIFIFNNLKKEK